FSSMVLSVEVDYETLSAAIRSSMRARLFLRSHTLTSIAVTEAESKLQCGPSCPGNPRSCSAAPPSESRRRWRCRRARRLRARPAEPPHSVRYMSMGAVAPRLLSDHGQDDRVLHEGVSDGRVS